MAQDDTQRYALICKTVDPAKTAQFTRELIAVGHEPLLATAAAVAFQEHGAADLVNEQSKRFGPPLSPVEVANLNLGHVNDGVRCVLIPDIRASIVVIDCFDAFRLAAGEYNAGEVSEQEVKNALHLASMVITLAAFKSPVALPVTNSRYYDRVLEELKRNGGNVSDEFRHMLQVGVMGSTALSFDQATAWAKGLEKGSGA